MTSHITGPATVQFPMVRHGAIGMRRGRITPGEDWYHVPTGEIR